MYVVGRESQLTLTNVTAPTHGGTYDCVVINDAGAGFDSVTLNVHPTIVQDPEDALAENGATVNLTCLAESFPYPTYQWQRMDRISGEYLNIPGETEPVFTLYVEYDNYGRYRCVATNVIDGIERTANSLSALVTGKPTLLPCCSVYRFNVS